MAPSRRRSHEHDGARRQPSRKGGTEKLVDPVCFLCVFFPLLFRPIASRWARRSLSAHVVLLACNLGYSDKTRAHLLRTTNKQIGNRAKTRLCVVRVSADGYMTTLVALFGAVTLTSDDGNRSYCRVTRLGSAAEVDVELARHTHNASPQRALLTRPYFLERSTTLLGTRCSISSSFPVVCFMFGD